MLIPWSMKTHTKDDAYRRYLLVCKTRGVTPVLARTRLIAHAIGAAGVALFTLGLYLAMR